MRIRDVRAVACGRILLGAAVLGVCCFAAGAGPATAPAPAPVLAEGTARDVETVRQRLYDRFLALPGMRTETIHDPARQMQTLGADGRWPDIDYADETRGPWKPGVHVGRVFELARAYRTPGGPLFGKPEARAKILAALRWWITNDLQNSNWWWNEIGVPEYLGRAMILMGDDFPADLRPGARTILLRANRRDMTGQNTLWFCGVRLTRGCLEKDPAGVAAAFERIAREIYVSNGEGVQPDFSFHQHGAQLYSGGYGQGFSTYGPMFARLAAGTPFAFAPEKVEVLTSYLLDGQQWMIRGPAFDPGAIGRQITRPGQGARSLGDACDDLAAIGLATGGPPAAGSPRKAELEAFARRLRGEKGEPPLVGNRHFRRSDFMVHQRPAWYASCRMFSSRTLNTELVNGEGQKSHHLADALTLLMLAGDDYAGLPPVWDWQRLPGVTCEQGVWPKPLKERGRTSFVGGASDGLYGAAAMDLKRSSVTARAARFFFDNEMVALGAGITDTGDGSVFTSVDQRRLRGKVTVAEKNGVTPAESPRGKRDLKSPAWVHHEGFAYVFPAGGAVRLAAETQTGSWREIADSASADPVSADVFSLGFDHGVRPVGGTYAYVVASAASAAEAAKYAATPAVEIVSNTPDLQAVRHRGLGLTQVVFWKPGRAAPAGGAAVAADQPCIALMREMRAAVRLTGEREAPAGLRLAVANPENKPLVVTLEIGRPLTGEGATWSAERKATAVRFDLPGGNEAGKTVVRELQYAR